MNAHAGFIGVISSSVTNPPGFSLSYSPVAFTFSSPSASYLIGNIGALERARCLSSIHYPLVDLQVVVQLLNWVVAPPFSPRYC